MRATTDSAAAARSPARAALRCRSACRRTPRRRAALATGSGSPVIVAWSTSLAPSTTAPSAPIRSPGRTSTTSPTRRSAAATVSLAPSAVEPGRRVRGQVEQSAHRVLGALGRDRLQRAGGGEDDDEQRAVEDLPDRRGAERGDDHQQVDVEGLVAQRLQPGPAPAPSHRRRSSPDTAPTTPRPAPRRAARGHRPRTAPVASAAQRTSGNDHALKRDRRPVRTSRVSARLHRGVSRCRGSPRHPTCVYTHIRIQRDS